MDLYTLYGLNNIIILIVYIVLPSFVGSYASDYIKTLRQQNIKVNFKKAILSSIITIIIVRSFLDWILYIDRRELLPLISLIIGLLGFEILYGFSSLDNIVILLKRVSLIIGRIINIVKQISELFSLTTNNKDENDD